MAKRTSLDPPPEKPAPSEKEYGYLHQVLQRHGASEEGAQAEELVCESRDWVERCAQAPFKNWFPNLYDAIWSSSWHDTPGGELVNVPNKSEWAILVRYFPQQKALHPI